MSERKQFAWHWQDRIRHLEERNAKLEHIRDEWCAEYVAMRERNAKFESALSWLEDYEPFLVDQAREKFLQEEGKSQ